MYQPTVFMLVTIVMVVLTNVHAVMTDIKKKEDYTSQNGTILIGCQSLSIFCCFSLITALTVWSPIMSWMVVVVFVLLACAASAFMTKDLVEGKKYTA